MTSCNYPRLPRAAKGIAPTSHAIDPLPRTSPFLCFQSLPTIKSNYPMRIVCPERSEGSLCVLKPDTAKSYVPVCFQQLATIKFRNHFVLTTIRIAGVRVVPISRFSLFQSPSSRSDFCTPYLSPLVPTTCALFCATEPSQPLSHQPLPHSLPCNGGGRVRRSPIFHFHFSIFCPLRRAEVSPFSLLIYLRQRALDARISGCKN